MANLKKKNAKFAKNAKILWRTSQIRKKARLRNRVFCLGNDSYTTNAVEGFHRMLRKFTKTKTNFPTDDSLKKSIYLSVKEISKKWNNPVRDWGKIIGQFMMFFEERFGEIRTA